MVRYQSYSSMEASDAKDGSLTTADDPSSVAATTGDGWARASKRQKRSSKGKGPSPWSDYPVEDPDTPITAQDFIHTGSLRMVRKFCLMQQ